MSSIISVLPLETIEIIIDIVAFNDDKEYISTTTCALVCHTFLPLARKHIFASITLNNATLSPGQPRQPTPLFQRLLSTTPEIADHIRNLNYCVVAEDLKSLSLANVLKQITRLQSLTVQQYERRKIMWNNNPLRPALLHLLHLPTLTHLRLFGIGGFVVSDLIPCIGLKHLDIAHVTAADSIDDLPRVPDKPVRLSKLSFGLQCSGVMDKMCTTMRPDGNPVIDFGGLTNISVEFGKADSVEVGRKLLKKCMRLTDVTISVIEPALTLTGFAEMVSPSLSTLRRVRLVITIGQDSPNDDPLSGLASELEELNNKNIIETLAIEVNVVSDETCKTGDEWGILDKVLKSPGWSLKRFFLSIQISRYDTNNDELEQALMKLPETQLSRLSSSKTLDFKFRVTNVLV